MAKKTKPQRNEAITTCALIVVLYAAGMVTYIAAGHSCAGETSGEASKICGYKAKADSHLGNFPQYTAWLEQNFHAGWNHIQQKLHG